MSGLIAVKTKVGIAGAPIIETDAVTSLVIRDQLPEVGSLAESSLTVPVTAADGTVNPILAELQDGRVVQVRAQAGSAAGFIHAFLIEKRNRDVYDAVDPSKRQWEIVGRTLPACLTDARWKPTRGYKSWPWSSRRTFSFASPEFSVASWPGAQEIVRQDAPSTYYQGKPAQGWPDPTAYWITAPGIGNTDAGGHIGIWWTVGEFTVATATTVILLWAADNKADVYFDGQMISRGDIQKGFGQTQWVTLYVTPGTHRIAAKVYNVAAGTIDDPPFGLGAFTAGNPTAFIASCYVLNTNGTSGGLLIHTDHLWPTLAWSAFAPGLTYGQILNIGLDEAQADGLIPYVTRSFDGGVDTNGANWAAIESVTVNVGDSILQSLDTWSLTYGDYAMPASAFRLDAYKPGTRGTDKSGTIIYSAANQNLTHLAEDSTADITDCLIVEWEGGQFRWPAAGGDHMGFISTGAATTTEAKGIADAYLALHSGDLTQITPAIAPRAVAEGPRGVLPSGWWVGDSISVEGVTDRVQSLIGTWQEGSGFDWAVALRTVHMKTSDALKRWLALMIPGAAGGQAPQSVPTGIHGGLSLNSSSGFTSAAALDGTLDGIHAKIAVVPDASDNQESGIVVKAPTATWGKPLYAGGDPNYGKGQFISFHRFVAGLDDDPNDSLLFRVDSTGGLGLTGGVHIATGLRQEVGYSVTQAVWINPTLDLVDIVMTGVAGKTLPFLLATNSVGAQLFKVFSNGAIQSAAEISARTGLTTQIAIGDIAGFPSIQFGNDSTTFLARGSIAGRIQATNYLDALKDMVAWKGDTNKQVLIGDVFGVAGIAFGSAIDTIVYRGTVAGQVAASNSFAVINGGSTSNVLLTLKGVSGQTGDHVRGVNSVGTTIWSISAAGVFSPSPAVPSPLSIAGNITAHNADAQLTQIGSIFGSAGIGLGSTADTILIRTGAGAAQISDTLTVQNVSHSSANVIAAIGASGQSGFLFVGVQSTGGTVFGVTNAGAVSAVSASLGTITGSSLNTSGGTITGGVISGTDGTFSGNVGVTGTTFSSGISNGNAGIVSTGAISGATSLAMGGSITGATSIAGTSLNVGTGTVTCGQVSAGSSTSFVHSVSSTNAIAAATFSATTVGGTSAFKAITGTSLNISPGPKTFVIDHPLNPDLKLVHACIEGPENAVYYRGEDVIGHDGTVVVRLPAYFEPLTASTGRTIQLTPVYEGKPVQVISATPVVDGSFMVAGHAGQRFYWIVTAVRDDIPALEAEQDRALWPMFDDDYVPDFGLPVLGPQEHPV